MRFKLRHSRFSLRRSWWFLFYHMTNRYQKQGAIKIIIKIIITFVNFRFISSHFRGLQINFRIQAPHSKAHYPERAHKSYNFQFNIRLFSSYWKYEIPYFFRMFPTRDPRHAPPITLSRKRSANSLYSDGLIKQVWLGENTRKEESHKLSKEAKAGICYLHQVLNRRMR